MNRSTIFHTSTRGSLSASHSSYGKLFRTVLSRTLFVFGASVFALAAIAQQKPSAVAPPVSPSLDKAGNLPLTLRMRFKQGEVSLYKMSMRSSLPLEQDTKGAAIKYDTNVDLTIQQTVQKVNTDGSAEIEVATRSGSGLVNGAPFKTNDSKSVITLDTMNNILSAKHIIGTPSGSFANSMFQSGELSTQGVYLPRKPVKVGETWIQTVRIQGLSADNKKDGKASTAGSVKSTFVRLENIGLFNTVRLHSELRVPFVVNDKSDKVPRPMNGMLTMTYDSNVSLSTGQVVRSAGIGDIALDVPGWIEGDSGSNGKGKATKPGPERKLIKRVTVKLQVGNNLITQ